MLLILLKLAKVKILNNLRWKLTDAIVNESEWERTKSEHTATIQQVQHKLVGRIIIIFCTLDPIQFNSNHFSQIHIYEDVFFFYIYFLSRSQTMRAPAAFVYNQRTSRIIGVNLCQNSLEIFDYVHVCVCVWSLNNFTTYQLNDSNLEAIIFE